MNVLGTLKTNYRIENICHFAYNESIKACSHECVCGEVRDDLDCGDIKYTLPNCVKRPPMNYYGVTIALFVLLAMLVVGAIVYYIKSGIIAKRYEQIEKEVNKKRTKYRKGRIEGRIEGPITFNDGVPCSARIGSYVVYYLCCAKFCCESKLPTKLPIKMRITRHHIILN